MGTNATVLGPMVLTVGEVMVVLRIGRTKAYEQARLFLETNGAAGIPCVRIGDSIRFPRHAIEAIIDHPLTTCMEDRDVDDLDVDDPPASTRPTRRRASTVNSPQLFTA